MNLNIKRLIVLTALVTLILLTLFTQSSILKIIFALLLIIFVSFIVFFKSDQLSTHRKFLIKDNSDINTEEKDNEELEIETTPINDRILTSEDLIQEKKIAKISQLKPSHLREHYLEIANEPVPTSTSEDARFNFILEKILEVIKSILPAHSVIFFWYNKLKGQVIFHTYASDELEIQKIRYNLGDDIVSKVIVNGSPEYINNINSNVEASLIRYYKNPINIKSVVAVPVFFNEQLIGVLVADSKSEDSFGTETAFLLGKFVRLITLNLSIFDDKFSISTLNQKFEALINLIVINSKELNETTIIQKLVVSFDSLLEWDVLAIVLYSPDLKQYVVQKTLNRSSLVYIGEGNIVELKNTLVGKAIETGNSIKIDDAKSYDYFVYRNNQNSNIQGSIIIVPIISPNMVYGAFVFENLKINFYTNEDVRLVEKIANFFSTKLDALYNQKLLDEYLSIDLETLLLNKNTFIKRVNEELIKFRNFPNVNFGFAFIQVDKADKLVNKYSNKISSKILKHVTFCLKNNADDLTLMGRIDRFKFGVLFLNKESTESFLLCEKIRSLINKEVLSFDNQQVNVSVSIGHASGRGNTPIEKLFNDAELALEKAISEGGNKVKSVK